MNATSKRCREKAREPDTTMRRIEHPNVLIGSLREEYLAYKFRKIDHHFIASIENSQLYFSSPKDLNDPFDCQIEVLAALRKAVSQTTGLAQRNLEQLVTFLPAFFEDFQNRLRNVGICAFAGEIINPLLWAHYADGHKGVCLLYRFPGSFVANERNDFIGFSDVNYSTDPLTTWFRSIALKLPQMGFEVFRNELLFTVTTIKDKCWSYEKEGRLIKNGAGTLEVERSFLIQVCFGINCSSADMAMLKDLLRVYGYKVTFGKADKKKGDFGIDAYEIS